ncbi:MAG TPA: hypothetical protein VFU00_08960 [Gemmatimonadales bacterium]|nr:hypothetical protein [Gemmatimonadales bacterium]
MSIDAHIEPLGGKLPTLAWRWDPETDILSGAFKASRKVGGLTGSVELSDDLGSVAVLDVSDGVICGLDIVVWPEVTSVPTLAVPAQLTEGRVVVAKRPSKPGISSMEVDTSLSVRTDPTESVFHLRIGPERSVEVIRSADHLYIEVDEQGTLAGFWLTGVPPFPDFDDD